MNLPEKYISKMKELLKDEYKDYILSFESGRYYGLRANTIKINPYDLKNKLKFNLQPISWCKEGFYYDETERPAKSPYYNAGLFYIQEPSAMSTASILDIRPGDRVLDLCAAPGGKSTQAGAKLKGCGIIVSNDISASRCKALLKNIEMSGIKNAVVTNETPERLALKFKRFFNRIIVDAPCSGEGMFRKDTAAIKSWEEHKSEICALMQKDILKCAAKMLSDGGIIAYSTCTFAPEENEEIINEFLNENTEFKLLDIDKSLGFDNGRFDWVKPPNCQISKCGRLWPFKIKGEGHFLALLKKDGDDKTFDYSEDVLDYRNKKLLEELYIFNDKYLNMDLKGIFEIHGRSVMKLPIKLDLSGLRIVRSGLYIGDIKTKRFEPSQAFAMSIKKEDVKFSVNYSIDSPNLYRYLKGESYKEDGEEGWNLVCIDDFPLGWAKIQNGRLKNKYLPSWKINA